MTPLRITTRTYQVGFGDCFLLSFDYADSSRHVLVDFGSTAVPAALGSDHMVRVAENIAERCDGKLTAVIATHRHKDHISGFATKRNRTSSGRIIAELEPDLVLQPWTEDPNLDPAATGPIPHGLGEASFRHVASLASMQVAAREILNEARRARSLDATIGQELRFLGETNIANKSAVENLQRMGLAREFASAFSNTTLQQLLPGVEVDILGPPTLDQFASIGKQRSRDADEFWHLVAGAASALGPSKTRKAQPLFPDHLDESSDERYPVDARWLIRQAKRLRGDQMLRIVRILDQALNNTSLILLFRAGSKSLLFPGDAQIESWTHALSHESVVEKLRTVDLYKVGHHGSLNATPRTLWELFERKSKNDAEPTRLISLLSTMAHHHGDEAHNTEVPRKALLRELDKESALFSTQALEGRLYHDTVLEL